jgi:hypothetical protein
LGFKVIWQNQGLLVLVTISTVLHFLAATTWMSILPALILARSANNDMALANVQGAMGLAGVLGGLVMGIWGGPKRKIHGFLLGVIFSFLLGDIPLAIGRSLPIWIAAAGLGAFFVPILTGNRETIWQTKISQSMQGRVFSVRNTLSNALIPAGYILGGVLADQLLEPAMAVDGELALIFGKLVGVGPGAGMALMFLGTAIIAITMTLIAYLFPAVRHVEDERPSLASQNTSQAGVRRQPGKKIAV